MLCVDGISFSYPGKKVLDGVSFIVEDHDIFAVLGRNAAGKTTLINVLIGLLDQQAGQILVDGKEITSANSAHYVGVMRPLVDVYLKMSVYEYLTLMGTLFDVPGKELYEKIAVFSKLFDFEEHLYKKLKSCSLGTKKKVEFCAAILHNPRFVILDEPFDSIDPIVCYEMKRFLTEYVQKEGTVIVTSHALDLIQNFCNKYIIIHNGVVAASGNTQDADHLEQVFIDVVGTGEENE